MRRIGASHMVVLPMQRAAVLSIEAVKRHIAGLRQAIAKTEAQLDLERLRLADLERQVVAFETLPVERFEGDPVEVQSRETLEVRAPRRPVALSVEALDGEDPEPPVED